MKFSVITPVKNGIRWMAEAMESVISQRGDFDIEYLIMDGGSDDGTTDLVESFQKRLENGDIKAGCRHLKIFLDKGKDASMYEALAKGLNQATGDIISYLNADDFYLPNAFSTVATVFETYKNIKWLTGFPVRYNANGQIIRSYIPFRYETDMIQQGFHGTALLFLQQESVFWRRELHAILDTEKLSGWRLAGDFYLWYTFAGAGYEPVVVESMFGGNRFRPDQLSSQKEAYYTEFFQIRKKPEFYGGLKALVYRLVERFGGMSVKRGLSRRRVWFTRDTWVFKTGL